MMLNITVIITTHNYGRFVQCSIGSALRQTAQPKQIIVVDDASTDDTSIRVAPFTDRVKYVRVDFRNPQKTRNAGLALASGDYVLFLDADDYLTPTALEDMESVLQAQPSLKAVYGDRYVFGDEGSIRKLGKGRYWTAEDFSLDTLRFRNLIDISALIRRRDFPGFDDRIRRLQDWDTWLSFLHSDNDATCIHRPTLHYRVHSKNLTFNRNELIERFKILLKHDIFHLETQDGSAGGGFMAHSPKTLVVAHSQAASDREALFRAVKGLGLRGTVLCLMPSCGMSHEGRSEVIRTRNISFVTVYARDAEELVLSRAGYLADPSLKLVALIGHLDYLPSIGPAFADEHSPQLRSSMRLPQIMATERLEQIDIVVLNRHAARYLAYMAPDDSTGAADRISAKLESWYQEHVGWRFLSKPKRTSGFW